MRIGKVRAGTLVALVMGGCCALMAPEGSAKHRILVEVGPGVTIPLTRYFDVKADDSFVFVENSAHAAVNVSALFGGWTFRYAANMISLGHGERRWSTAFHGKLNNFLQNIGSQGLPQESQGELDDTVTFHSLSFGYRFYFTDTRWQPYVPLELGAVFATSETFGERTLYGLTASTGFGLDVQLWRWLYAGVAVRYNFVMTEGLPETALVGLTSDSPQFSNAVNMAHLISVTAQLQARY